MIKEWRDLSSELLEHLDPQHEPGGDGPDFAQCNVCLESSVYSHDGGLSGGYEHEITHEADCVYIRAHDLLGNEPHSLMGSTPPQVLRLATKKKYGWSGSRQY